MAAEVGLLPADRRSSAGICFIGEPAGHLAIELEWCWKWEQAGGLMGCGPQVEQGTQLPHR